MDSQWSSNQWLKQIQCLQLTQRVWKFWLMTMIYIQARKALKSFYLISKKHSLSFHLSERLPRKKLFLFQYLTGVAFFPMKFKCSKIKKQNLRIKIYIIYWRYFPKYSFDNCAVECKMRKTIEICECMPYNFYNTLNTEICNVTKIECLQKNFGLTLICNFDL